MISATENKRGLIQRLAPLVPPLALVAGSLFLFIFLLRRFPYDGFYAPDNYAYYYQARALWEQITGALPRSYELFTADGLQHWPVGYHIQLIVGFLLNGVTPMGGWLLTILMTALCPALLYWIMQRLFRDLYISGYVFYLVIAGVISGVLISLNATFTRTGLSLMSDVPSCFWALLSIYFFVRAAPMATTQQSDVPASKRQRGILFALAGFSLGLAVLIRYGALLLAVPIAIYLIFAALPGRRNNNLLAMLWSRLSPALWSIPFFLLALVPQALYLMTHNPGTGVSDFLGGISLSNIFATTTYSTDGTSTFQHPMIIFYLLDPVWQVQSGFFSPFFIPAIGIGIFFLLAQHHWRIVAFLLSWWFCPALIYAM
ncbi:MAG: hypothetical protein ABIQ44_14515, partial [Chloroflexia bacterium]